MGTDNNQNTGSQIDRANNILLQLKPNVTAQDREDAQKELNLGEATVNRYLLGEGRKVETALDLIEFFQKRIEDREKKLLDASA
jgi:hypothetical protein